MATQSGVLAALMAQKGYTGTEAIFEGKEGLMDVFGPDWDTGALLGDLGKSFKILECSMKAFPTEALTHTHISAAIKIVSENDIDYRDIASVTITTIARACDILFDPHKYRPDSRETADHSLPYCIACALVDRKVTTQSFDDERIYDPRIREVIDKIHGEASEEFEKMFPAKQPSRVRIRLKNGKEYSVYLEYPKGDPREPMTEADLDAKVSALCADRYDANKLKDILFRCDTMSTREMMEKL
jgi:2-methylcitrate dehydratase